MLKRVQKNLKALADKGYFILSKLGNKKVIAFTDKCRLYGKLEPENGQDLDRKRSESGPKTVRALYKYTISNNNYNNNKSNNAKNGFFAFVGDMPQKEEGEKIRGTSEKNKCLFEKSRFFDFELFRECFNTPEFEKVDLVYYYNVVKDWSASKGRMQKDWIAQTRNIIRADYRRGQIKYTSDSGEEKA